MRRAITRRSALVTALAVLAALVAIGVAGYMTIAGMGLTDALYMTVITLSTVGFREVAPLTGGGKLFTIFLIVSGLGLVLYTATVVAQDVVEGGVQRALGRRRVQRQIDRLSDHYIVCGFGRMGRIVCKELVAKPVRFVVIEHASEALKHIEEEQFLCVEGDATEEESLERAGIRRARGLVSALSKDSDNVYVVLTARELNPELLIVARAEDDRSETKLVHAGATRVVSPYVIGASRMASALLRPAVLDVIDLATHYRSMELKIEELAVAPAGFADGVSMQDSGLRDKPGLIVIAIKKRNGDMVFNPEAEARIEAGDRLVVMGQTQSLRDLEQRLSVG